MPTLALVLIFDTPRVDATGRPVAQDADAWALLQAFVLMVQWIYFAVQESSPRQATVGKRRMGLVVTDVRGRRMTFNRASARYFGKVLCSFTFGLGFLLAAVTRRRQGLHDLVASTLVIVRR